MVVVRRLTGMVCALLALAAVAAAWPFLFSAGPGPSEVVSMRGEAITLYGYGPYRHMPADIAVQGLAQDLVTLFVALPVLAVALWWARRGAPAGYLALTGAVGYLFVQYVLYLAMGTYNELFLLWVLVVLIASQLLVRLLLAGPPVAAGTTAGATARRYVGGFLLFNGSLIALLWLSVIVPPLFSGTLYPEGLAHLTTMVVQGFDLALFLPPSLLAGYWYLWRRPAGDLLAPAYAVFLCLQMTALLAKILWMQAVGAGAGPALIIIPVLLVGALVASYVSLRPVGGRNRGLPAD